MVSELKAVLAGPAQHTQGRQFLTFVNGHGILHDDVITQPEHRDSCKVPIIVGRFQPKLT
jgi:hypothetical protein